MLLSIFKLMRLHHSIKNLLVLFPLFFVGGISDVANLCNALKAFASFTFLATAVYAINDCFDAEADRLHPLKRMRPIASGKVSFKQALIFIGVFIAGSFAIVFFLPGTLKLAVILLGYLTANILYSCKLKHFPVIDIAILASGFLMRILFGSVATGVPISHWLALTVLVGACYLSLGKRRNELRDLCGGETRQVLKSYSVEFLDKNMYLCQSISLVFYALWTISQEARGMIWSFPFVLLIFMRYNLTVEKASSGDPVEVLLGDKILLLLCILTMAFVGVLLYFPGLLKIYRI